MKRLIIVLLLMAGICTNAKAQWYFGGGFGFHAGSDSALYLNISPEAGYRFSDYFTAGGRLSYVSGYNRVGIDPYIRTYMLKRDCPVRIAMSVHTPVLLSREYTDYGIYIQPGISILTGANMRFECHFGAFGWGASRHNGMLTSSGWEASITGYNTSVGMLFYM